VPLTLYVSGFFLSKGYSLQIRSKSNLIPFKEKWINKKALLDKAFDV
jgi:hypothetical protein